MKKLIIVVISLFFFSKTIFSQLTINQLAFLQGNWIGELEYTDYQDDKKQVQLKTIMNAAMIDNKIKLTYIYTEPDSSLVYSDSDITISKKGDGVRWGSMLFKMVSENGAKTKEKMLVMETKGEDNNKKALIRETLRVTNDSLTILKEVKYVGTESFLIRHIYRLKKENSDETQSRLLKSLLGTWELDLRPTPESEPYLKDFEIKDFKDGLLKGVFYETDFNDGKINADWGIIHFAFTTADQSGTYFHSGHIEKGQIKGISFSTGRGFMIPWMGKKK
jgi:hypothetical protein